VLDASTLNVARFGLVDYGAALAIQDALVAARQRDVIGDTLLLLQHPATYTLGRGADARFILDSTADVPIYRVSRGGQVTFHGPGQLIGYPILKLEGADRDVIRYLRKLEQALIEALAACGLMANRREGLTGVWVGTAKLASIGIGIRRWVTLHGFAVNVATDLAAFDRIVPCGIEGCRMTSIAKLGHPEISLTAFAGLIERAFATVFGYAASEALEASAAWSLIDAVAAGTEAHG
jgi:lipoyl(octanoyl) transferase